MRKTNLIIGVLFVCIFVAFARLQNKRTVKTKSKQTELTASKDNSLIDENNFI